MSHILCSGLVRVSELCTHRLNLLAKDIGIEPEKPTAIFISSRALPNAFVIQRMLGSKGVNIKNLVINLSYPCRTDLGYGPP